MQVSRIPSPLALLLAGTLLAAGCDDGQANGPTDDPIGETEGQTEGQTDDPAESPTASAPDGVSAFEEIPELVREVAPSTVAIEVTGVQAGAAVQGAGSGVVWDADGIVITNHHVVAAGDELVVVLADGTRYEAGLRASDPRTDLAVLEIEATGLPTVPFADELPDIGELAIALGNPLGFQNTATAGIVSGIDRTLPVTPDSPPLAGLIQTDAAISSGNSGGALIDGTGSVIGINVAAVGDVPAPGTVAQGLGFAIPSTTVVPVVEQLLAQGEVDHAFLGIRGAPLTPQLAERFGLERDRGVLVGEVQPGGPADEAGLVQGDVIVAIDDTRIDDLGDLFAILQRRAPGDRVTVTVVREGDEQDVEVVLGELPVG